jgi:hypothetical protein
MAISHRTICLRLDKILQGSLQGFLKVRQYKLPLAISITLTSLIPSGTNSTGAENLSPCSCSHFLTPGIQASDSINLAVSSTIRILAPALATRVISQIALPRSLNALIPPTWNTVSNVSSRRGRSSALPRTNYASSCQRFRFLWHFFSIPQERSNPKYDAFIGK